MKPNKSIRNREWSRKKIRDGEREREKGIKRVNERDREDDRRKGIR